MIHCTNMTIMPTMPPVLEWLKKLWMNSANAKKAMHHNQKNTNNKTPLDFSKTCLGSD